MRNILFVLILFCSIHGSFAQKIEIQERHLQLVDEIKEKFEDTSIACDQFRSVYTFELTDEGKLQVISNTHKALVAAESNVRHNEQIYYSDKVKVESSEFKNLKDRKFTTNTWCGHYSVNGIFHSDAQLCNYELYLARKGEYVSMDSKIRYLDPKYLTTVYFQSNNPTRSRIIEFVIPEFVEVEFVEYNFDELDIKRTEYTANGIKTIRYETSLLDKFSDNPNTPGHSYYMPHLMVLTKYYTVNGLKKDVLSTTSSLYSWYKSLIDLRKQNKEALTPLVESLTADLETDEEKIKAIYYWVQDNIKYIAFENGIAGFKPENSDKVYADKYGDCKGMANLTAQLLSIAGYDARLTWIGTDYLNYSYKTPSLAVDNHMICTVKLDEDFLYLDATEKNNSYGNYADRIQGKEIMIEDGNSYLIRQIPIEPIDKYLQNTEVHYRLNDSGLTATATESIKGEFKKLLINTHELIPMAKSDLFYKTIVAGNAETNIIRIINEPVLEREKPLELIYDVNMNNNYNQFGQEIYLDLDYKKDLKDRKIKENRKIPYKFETRIYRKTYGELAIPIGMKVNHIPKSVELKSDYFIFNASYVISDNVIQYKKNIKILKKLLPPEHFEEWNEAIKQLKDFYEDQIILGIE